MRGRFFDIRSESTDSVPTTTPYWKVPIKTLLSLAATAPLSDATSQANATLSVVTNVTSIRDADAPQKPVWTIREADVTSDWGSWQESAYRLLLNVGFSKEKAVVLLFLDSAIDVEDPTVKQARVESIDFEYNFEWAINVDSELISPTILPDIQSSHSCSDCKVDWWVGMKEFAG